MNKTILLIALGFAAASANFLDFERNLQSGQAACTVDKTKETCTGIGYCCAAVTKAGAAQANSTCVPAEFNGQTFNVSNVIYGLSCNFATTVTTVATAVGSCNDTNPCAAGSCCGTRSWTLGGAAGSKAATKSCIASASNATAVNSTSYVTPVAFAGLTAQVNVTCPAPASTTTTTDTTSFGVAMKASVMIVFALISALLF